VRRYLDDHYRWRHQEQALLEVEVEEVVQQVQMEQMEQLMQPKILRLHPITLSKEILLS
jgi:hypothetical protein